ncbi:aa3-type cytochrome c oxidase subunit IV [Paracoccaceae bacterium GXU_MW_L88]
MAEGHSEHKPGEMDITAQKATFDGTVKWTIRTIIFLICLMIFLAIFRV